MSSPSTCWVYERPAEVPQPDHVGADGAPDRVAAAAQEGFDVTVAGAAERDQIAPGFAAETAVVRMVHL